MNASPSQPLAPGTAGTIGTRDWTRWGSLLTTGLFLPAALAVLAVAYSSESAARCLGYGEECGWQPPGGMFTWGLGVSLVACATVLVAPAVRVRYAALAVQLLAQGTVLVAVLGSG
ncbi:hypothetical protein ACFVIM_22870 [Streptomyces sp. NPDC057638]|uniref:hypothetical protein n=1 Tax=Streptomyces sp. NPDC057638 TaxID=3346190 RepID=UPI00369B62FC